MVALSKFAISNINFEKMGVEIYFHAVRYISLLFYFYLCVW